MRRRRLRELNSEPNLICLLRNSVMAYGMSRSRMDLRPDGNLLTLCMANLYPRMPFSYSLHRLKRYNNIREGQKEICLGV